MKQTGAGRKGNRSTSTTQGTLQVLTVDQKKVRDVRRENSTWATDGEKKRDTQQRERGEKYRDVGQDCLTE